MMLFLFVVRFGGRLRGKDVMCSIGTHAGLGAVDAVVLVISSIYGVSHHPNACPTSTSSLFLSTDIHKEAVSHHAF